MQLWFSIRFRNGYLFGARLYRLAAKCINDPNTGIPLK